MLNKLKKMAILSPSLSSSSSSTSGAARSNISDTSQENHFHVCIMAIPTRGKTPLMKHTLENTWDKKSQNTRENDHENYRGEWQTKWINKYLIRTDVFITFYIRYRCTIISHNVHILYLVQICLKNKNGVFFLPPVFSH